jgi:RecB family endonuclease NucS
MVDTYRRIQFEDDEMRKSKALINPPSETSLSLIQETLDQNRTLLIAGVCTVQYRGRATSTLEEGERLLFIKADGNVLVHRPTGLEPINYMSSTSNSIADRNTGGCFFHTTFVENELVITILNRKLREHLKISFTHISAILSLDFVDSGDFYLYASEKDMQRAILLKPVLIEEGFRVINYEKKITPGFIDVYGMDSQGRFVVVEIKRRSADRSAVMQLQKYLNVIRGERNNNVRGIVAAPRLSKGVQKLLATLNIEFKMLDPKTCAELLDKTRQRDTLDRYFNAN